LKSWQAAFTFTTIKSKQRELIEEPEFDAPTVDISIRAGGVSDLEVCRTLVPEMVKLNGYEHGKRFKVEML
jgi:hypothetical protein